MRIERLDLIRYGHFTGYAPTRQPDGPFDCGENWDRWEPQNGDGCLFSHSDDPRIEIRGWAGYAVLHVDIDSSVESFIDYQRKEGFFELISTTDVTRSVTNINVERPHGPPTQIAVKATRIVYRAGAV